MQNAIPWRRTGLQSPDRSGVRAARGLAAHASGHSAEQLVADHYKTLGYQVLERCWRSAAGEVDLILRDGDQLVFVEVKKAENFDLAAFRISRRQMDRICMAALLYADSFPSGALTEMRFDAALVDRQGGVQVLENAFGAN